MNDIALVLEKIENIYNWIEEKLQNEDGSCVSCGRCCDFANYDHRLYLTSPELIYFKEKLGTKNIKPMTDGKCPYNIDGKCSVYKHRFAGCRIFFCKAEKDRQSELSEQAIQKFKDLCSQFDIPCHYAKLTTALMSNSVN